MTLRRVIFWIHMVVGVSTGLIILLVSSTGVLLSYEKETLGWSGHSFVEQAAPASGARLPLNALIASAKEANGGKTPSSLTFYNGSGAVAAATDGPTLYFDSVSGKYLGSASTPEFFKNVRTWHRYVGMSGGNRKIGRAITGVTTIVFVFLIVAGLLLWFPRGPIWFKAGLKGKARNWNWHNVFGFWAAVPLFLVVLSGVVISYDWATNLVYRIVGTELPAETANRSKPLTDHSKIDPLLSQAEQKAADWKTVVLKLPVRSQGPVSFTIDRGNGAQPQLRSTLSLDQENGATIKWEQFENQDLGRRARSWFRYVHTGEYYGVAGQTVAGLASLAALMLVWTGLSLWLKRVLSWVQVRATRARKPRVQPAAAGEGALPAR
jgi:uncharacterized iron-regulated membrane protein